MYVPWHRGGGLLHAVSRFAIAVASICIELSRDCCESLSISRPPRWQRRRRFLVASISFVHHWSGTAPPVRAVHRSDPHSPHPPPHLRSHTSSATLQIWLMIKKIVQKVLNELDYFPPLPFNTSARRRQGRSGAPPPPPGPITGSAGIDLGMGAADNEGRRSSRHAPLTQLYTLCKRRVEAGGIGKADGTMGSCVRFFVCAEY